MTKEGVEQLVAMINRTTGSKMSVVGSGFAVKVVDENGRNMLGDKFMTPKELGDRAEGVLYFVQRGGVRLKEEATEEVEKGSA